MATEPVTEETLVPLLQRLVRYPSEQSAFQEADPAVTGFIRDCAAPAMEELGLDRLRYDAMGNLIAESGPAASTCPLVFVTYAMTHPAAAMPDPFTAAVIDTPAGPAIRGRGVAEQKTALAAAMAAVAQARASGLTHGLALLLLTSGETGRHDAAASALDALGTRPDHAIVCLGTDSRIGAGNKGRVDIEVTVRGKATHSSMPWNGINAIIGARRCLDALAAFDLRVPDHPQFGPATLTATSIRSFPDATHTVQDRVEMTFDRRLLPGEDPEAAYFAVAAALPDPAPYAVECRRGPLMYPNKLAADGTLMPLLERAYADAGLEAGTVVCDFALDAGYFAKRGIESVMLGPGRIDQFHSRDEHVLVSEMLEMAQIYLALIRRTQEA